MAKRLEQHYRPGPIGQQPQAALPFRVEKNGNLGATVEVLHRIGGGASGERVRNFLRCGLMRQTRYELIQGWFLVPVAPGQEFRPQNLAVARNETVSELTSDGRRFLASVRREYSLMRKLEAE